MIKYKLLTKNLTTHNGFKWEVGKLYKIDKPGNSLCSDEVFHFYDSPETAALFNTRHANISNPVCYSVEIDDIVAFDGLKGGAKQMRLIEQVNLPIFTKRQWIIFAIFSAKSASKYLGKPIHEWDLWAEKYLKNTAAAADAAYAAYAAYAAADAAYAAYAAAYAAYAAADAAYAAAALAAANVYPDFTATAKQALSMP
jgi:hypothetical protein